MKLEPHIFLTGENADGSPWILTLRDVPACPNWPRHPQPRVTPINLGVWQDAVRGEKETTCN